MNYWRLALLVTLSAFALLSIAFSSILSIAYPAVARRLSRAAPRRRASALWQLRVAPSAAAMLFALAVVLPTFLAFEPRDTQEPVSATLAGLAASAATLLVAAAVRGLRAWEATRAIERRWSATAAPWTGEAALPVRLVEDEFPIVAVVGVTAPRLYVAHRVLAECPARELQAMFAHEAAHVVSRDNLKRFVMRMCPDAVWVSAALERAWSSAAEEAADAAAAGASLENRLDLAQALLRVARLAPSREASPVSAFYLGGSIDVRVRRLLNPTDDPQPVAHNSWLPAAVVVALGASLVASAPAVHQLMESVLHFLP